MLRAEKMVVGDRVGYLPTINAPATSMATIHEMIAQSMRIKDQLGLSSIVVVCDQAINYRALEIKWKHPERFLSIILWMGAFHSVCTFIAVIGKRFGDAGLRDIAIESGVISEGSVKNVLDPRTYNRAIRFHKLVYET